VSLHGTNLLSVYLRYISSETVEQIWLKFSIFVAIAPRITPGEPKT